MIDTLDAMDEGDEDLLALVIAEFEMVKARERRFSSRSEAGRYAAQVRWGNRGTAATGATPSGMPVEATFDVAEAMATGRPYAPLQEEHFPQDLKDLQSEVEALPYDSISWGAQTATSLAAGSSESWENKSPDSVRRYTLGLAAHYEKAIADGLTGDVDGVFANQLKNNPALVRKMASRMALDQLHKVRNRAEVKQRIGEERAMSHTSALINGTSRKRVTIAADEDDAIKILNDGRVKNQFETNTSNGMLSRETRASHEAVAYGTHPLTKPQMRPVYGSVHPDGVQDPSANGTRQYGAVQFVMRDAVIDRSTASMQDSLGIVKQANPARKAVVPQWSTTSYYEPTKTNSPEYRARRMKRGQGYDYVEAQIHGGVGTKDVAYIAVPSGFKTSPALAEAAKRRGIPIVELPPSDGKLYGKAKWEKLDDAGVAKSTTLDMKVFLADAIEKARERKFNSRSEAGRYAAQIRWGNRGAAQTSDPATAALKERAMAIRSEIAEMTSRVDFGDVPVGNPKTGENWHDGPDSPPIIIDARTGMLVPSPRLCDLHDELLSVGGQLFDRAAAKKKKAGDDPEAEFAAQAQRWQTEVGAVRQLGSPVNVQNSVFIRNGVRDGFMEDTLVYATSTASKAFPADWNASVSGQFTLGSTAGSLQANFNPGTSKITLPDPALIKPGVFLGSTTMSGLAAHELTHAVEWFRPQVRLPEVAFMAHRTHGFRARGENEPLRDRLKAGATESMSYGITGEGSLIQVMQDRFKNQYSGRIYGKQEAMRYSQNDRRSGFYETLSTGMESYFGGNRQNLDKDHMSFVLGTLVST